MWKERRDGRAGGTEQERTADDKEGKKHGSCLGGKVGAARYYCMYPQKAIVWGLSLDLGALSLRPTTHSFQPTAVVHPVSRGPRPDSRYATIQVTGCLASAMYRQVPPAPGLVGCCSTRPPGHGPTHGDRHGCSSSQYLFSPDRTPSLST